MRCYLLFIYILSFPFQFCLSQSVEQAFGLRFSSGGVRDIAYCRISVDSTQITDDGFYPKRIKFYNKKKKRSWSNPQKISFDSIKDLQLYIWEPPKEDGCFFYWSKTVVLPTDAGKNLCTVTLNCKSEVDSLRFVVVALDKEDNELYTDSVSIPPTAQWADYSLAFRQKGVRAVQILIRYRGNVDANEGRSVYLSRIKIKVGNQELNDLPITSLVSGKDMQLKAEAIIPLSFEDDASLANIRDWKDKKIIALGEQIDGIRDLREVQIRLMRHLITSENSKLILLELPEDLCVRWNLYLQGEQPDLYEDQLIAELKSSLHNHTIFFEFLKWVRQYNAEADVPVRIIGIDNISDFSYRNRKNIFLTDYLLKLSANRQDSAYYLQGMHRHEYPQVKEYILQSELSNTLNKQDFQYLLFLMDEQIRVHAMSSDTDRQKESDLDKAKRIERILDIYLSPAEKAVLIAPSERINKRLPIRDSNFESDLLGSHLYQQYGRQYHAVGIQLGERSCLADTITSDSVMVSYYKKIGTSWIYPVIERALFPFAFEGAGMDNRVSYFYYPSSQLPEGILGLGLGLDYDLFQYCHILSHFDGLVFIREAKATRDLNSYPYGLRELVIDICSHLDGLLEELKE